MKIPSCEHTFSRLGGTCSRCGVRQNEIVFGPHDDGPTTEKIIQAASAIIAEARKEKTMHYRNGREAKNGDIVIQLGVTIYLTNRTLPATMWA
jgi:hypothetical protein